jgi:hypothetical protein
MELKIIIIFFLSLNNEILLSQVPDLYSFPIENIKFSSSESKFTDFSEKPMKITVKSEIKNISDSNISDPTTAFTTLFNILDKATYEQILFYEKAGTRKTEEYFSGYASERGNLNIYITSIIETEIHNIRTAFIKYKIKRFESEAIVGCYSFGLKDGKWLILNVNSPSEICMALSFTKDSVLFNLLSKEKNSNKFLNSLKKRVSVDKKINFTWLADYINNLVSNKYTRPEEFKALCEEPNWKNQ